MASGRWTALIAVLVAAPAVVVPAAAGPVHAAALPALAAVPAVSGDELVLSVDGRTWAPTVTTPLFDPSLVWVPGDVETGTLYARNASGEQARAVVTVLVDGDAALVEQVRVRTRLGSAAWTDGLRSDVADLTPGEVLPIGLEVAFDPAATNASQQQTARIDVVVTLSAAGPDEGGSADPGAAGPGSLPRTGANLLLPALVAAGAVLLGSVLLGRRGRRSDHG
ncbi:hypothetical protein AB1046_06530 [Promicromonospora sp. Populi]|uniref:hypothetical protein n=1 Tax=Promicromonospora sp. Populi TaxID=3239420 RepID=UPI0034E2C992